MVQQITYLKWWVTVPIKTYDVFIKIKSAANPPYDLIC
ncbi:hypothetical protein CWATWH0402_5696 [Crocosphaera watsonii WH 0402]|uniref:Uncharacterized protein n=2 Tax=Crocosphaera watsonii TaxID=263511 RepID=T2JMG3_CROWT|nr:hypothetical protein CWATWH0003_4676 [Crocosphaera watsonii WH 0003]CCQ66256.1 hypothetical protein CWATWH0402_5696 [Crocosphaera watsonii WH 0402]